MDFPTNFQPLAPCWIRKRTGQIIGGMVANTSTARGTQLIALCGQAVSGDVIHCGPGTFALGTGKLDVPHDVSLRGEGIGVTTITGTRVASTDGCVIVPGNATLIADMTINTSSGQTAYPIGCHRGATTPDKLFAGARIERVQLNSYIHGIYLSLAADDESGLSLSATDCETAASQRGGLLFANSGNAVVDIYATLNRCSVSQGTEAGAALSVIYAGSTAGGPVIIAVDQSNIGYYSQTAYRAIEATGAGVAVTVRDTVFASGQSYDLYQASSGAITVRRGEGSNYGRQYRTSGTIAGGPGNVFAVTLASMIGSPADGATYYIGAGGFYDNSGFGSASSTTEGRLAAIMPVAATLIGAQIYFRQAAGASAGASNIYLRNSTAGTDLLLSNAVDNSTEYQQINVTGLNQAYEAGNKIQGKWGPTPAWATNPGSCGCEIVLLFAT